MHTHTKFAICTSERALQENVQFKAGSIGPTEGRANAEAENQYSPVLPRAHRAAEGGERACNAYRQRNAECY